MKWNKEKEEILLQTVKECQQEKGMLQHQALKVASEKIGASVEGCRRRYYTLRKSTAVNMMVCTIKEEKKSKKSKIKAFFGWLFCVS